MPSREKCSYCETLKSFSEIINEISSLICSIVLLIEKKRILIFVYGDLV